MTNPKPFARPHPMRQQILGALVATRTITRTHRAVDPADPKNILGGGVTHLVPRFPLAENVSELNVQRTAERWIQ